MKTQGRLIAEELCAKFKETSSNALAKKLYKENPLLFKDVDSARSAIRLVRGKRGNIDRATTSDKSLFDKEIRPYVYELPKSSANEYKPFKINQSRVLILSDIHFPYQDNKAISLALDYGKKHKVDCILLNGDTIDFATISRHDKDWRNRSVAEEFESVRQFLKELRKHFPKAKIVWKDGNHCERWEKFLFSKAPEIFDDAEFRLNVRLKFGEYGIEHVTDKRPIKIGKLTVLHGHELAGGSGGVNPARATFLKTLNSVLVGHYHKTSSHTETNMNGEIISVQSTGCLCGLNPHYLPINKWNQGFAYVENNVKTGEYHLNNLKIYRGKIY